MIKFLEKNYLLLILILCSVLIVWPLFLQGYFFHHDDLQVMRVFEMRKCMDDLQLPCRWVPDMGYGNGYPLYNYYSALPYYIGGIFSYIFGFVYAAKVIFFIPLILGGVTMFYLGRELYGKWGGLVAGGLFMFAPYRALDIYVRGDVAESFGVALIPLVFYFNLRLLREKSILNLLGLAVSLAAFLTSHNVMTLFFVPIIVLFNLVIFYLEGWKNLKALILGGILGVGLAGFFLFPAFLEKNLVMTETLKMGGGNFRAHFVTVPQLFIDRSWGYGGSVFGPNDTISFQIGWPHWWLVVVAIIICGYFILKKKKEFLLPVFLILLFGFSIFMMHNKSTFIWERLDTLQYAQFPWRFLAVSIFAASLLGGFVVSVFKEKYKLILGSLILVAAILLNWQYFIPRDFYPWINDQNKLADPLWEIQQKAGILDYLPKTAYEPFGRAPGLPEVKTGEAQVANYNVRSNKFSFNAKVVKEANLEIPVFDFPNWKTFVNGKEMDHSHNNQLGRIRVDLGPGEYNIEGKLTDTPIRIISNTISFLSLAVLILFLFRKKWIAKL